MKQVKFLQISIVTFPSQWIVLGWIGICWGQWCVSLLFALQSCLLGGTEAQCYYDMEILEELFKIYQISFFWYGTNIFQGRKNSDLDRGISIWKLVLRTDNFLKFGRSIHLLAPKGAQRYPSVPNLNYSTLHELQMVHWLN